MAEGKKFHEWMYFAALMTVLVNINRDSSKGSAASIGDFHPLIPKKKQLGGVRNYLIAHRETARQRRLGLGRTH